MGALPLPTPLPAQPAETMSERHGDYREYGLEHFNLLNGETPPTAPQESLVLLPVKSRVLRGKLDSLVLKRHTIIHRLGQ